MDEENTNPAPLSATFEQMLDEELNYIRIKRNNAAFNTNENKDKTGSGNDHCDSKYAQSVINKASKTNLAGLAFSGGGIRSATFNLGVLQTLAKLKLLDQFDYLSTVSGGGYIGSWFSAWIKRKQELSCDIIPQEYSDESVSGKSRSICAKKHKDGFDTVCCELADSIGAENKVKHRAAVQPDAGPISHLREYSNYLSPKRGLWSTDTWTLGITYVRNLFLTFSLLFVTLVSLVLATRWLTSLYFKSAFPDDLSFYNYIYVMVPVLFCIFLFFACLLTSINIQSIENSLNKKRTVTGDYGAIFFTYLTAVTGSLWLFHYTTTEQGYFIQHLRSLLNLETNFLNASNVYFSEFLYILMISIAGLSGWILGQLWNSKRTIHQQTGGDEGSKQKRAAFRIVIAPITSVIVFIILLHLLKNWVETWPIVLPSDQGAWHIIVWGVPLFVLMFSVVAAVFVGVAGNALEELEREWLGRFFAALVKWTVLITVLVILVVYSPYWVKCLKTTVDGFNLNIGIGAIWGAISAVGAFLARNAALVNSVPNKWLQKAVLAIAPIVFITGMLILTISITDYLVTWFFLTPNADHSYWEHALHINDSYLFVSAFITMLIAIAWSVRVGVNQFSLHSMYADRLIRAYLGASNLDRLTHPFIGFAESDNDVRMADLDNSKDGVQYRGPYLIINAAINLVAGKRLAWQQRKAASFTFTSKYCGYEFCSEDENTDSHEAKRVGGYVKSRDYAGDDGVSLGKAMTISGAAASPNMGYHSNPMLTFLMTMFNVRLGWWLPNTAKQNDRVPSKRRGLITRLLNQCLNICNMTEQARLKKRGPTAGLLYLCYELFGKTDSKRDYIYLSDGGHFENLGIYELVRRRCRVIVACDAEADPERNFPGLGNAIEKCRTDLGVPIDIDTSQLVPDHETGLSPWHCAVGCIRYSDAHPGHPDGTLIYIKSSLTGDEPQDITTYAKSHNSFPHESTVDQWFNENQFESYRTLGEHIVKKVFGTSVKVAENAASKKQSGTLDLNRVVLELRKHWYSGNTMKGDIASAHDAELAAILDTLRSDTNLRFLDGQLYPNLEKLSWEKFHHLLSPNRHQYSTPQNYEQFRSGFYFCKRLLQFMQNVYYDNELELEYAAPRNRGWMNLFRRWSLSRMLRFTWTITAGTYGARFQSFCEHHLSLDSGEPRFVDKPLKIEATCNENNKVEMELSIEHKKLPLIATSWEDAEKQLGLHYYETRIIREFITAYIQHKGVVDLPYPLSFMVYPIKVFTDDPVEEMVDNDQALNAGMLIIGPSPRKPGNDESRDRKSTGKNFEAEKSVLYFRVRPSMRNMDIARKAFVEARNKKIINKTCPVNIIDDLPSIDDKPNSAWQRRAYRDVHFMHARDLNHCRWCAEIQNENDQPDSP